MIFSDKIQREKKLEKTERNSNIELLRIIAMLGVICLHYNYAGEGACVAAEKGSLNYFFLHFLETVSVCAVDTFVLISGYHLIKTDKRSLLKPAELIIELIVMNALVYTASAVRNGHFSAGGFLISLVPANYYVILYCTLYLISPLINHALNKLNETDRLTEGMILLLVLFSVWPTAVDLLKTFSGRSFDGLSTIALSGSGEGYTIVNFALLYTIGAWLGLTGFDPNRKKALLWLVISWAALYIWFLINYLTGLEAGKVVWQYCNPLVIIEAVLTLLVFKNINIKHSCIINRLAGASYTVFLLHIPLLAHMHVNDYANKPLPLLVLHLTITCLILYAICFVVYLLYDFLASRILRKLRSKGKAALEL